MGVDHMLCLAHDLTSRIQQGRAGQLRSKDSLFWVVLLLSCGQDEGPCMQNVPFTAFDFGLLPLQSQPYVFADCFGI